MTEMGDKFDKRLTVDVVIPTYKPDRRFARLIRRLGQQTYPINKIIVVNTEKQDWKPEYCKKVKNLEVHHVSRQEFDHGRTRNFGASLSQGDIMIFMTDDAIPKGRRLVERLVEALGWKGNLGQTVAVAYGRQMPEKGCHSLERFTRVFNYPDRSSVKTKEDLPRLGIKTYFASNVCCAYRKDIFEKLGGFVEPAIFNEDMIYAARAVQAGYGIAYTAEGRVIHSHNLTFLQQFRRNFDLAVSQADHPEVFEGILSEGEGIRLIKETGFWLVRRGKIGQIPVLIAGSAWKYAGYRLGKIYRILPKHLVLRCTTNPVYWERNLL